MRIVVVGGNGFIGSHFVAAAVRAGHDVVVSGTNPQPKYTHSMPFRFLPGGVGALADAPDELAAADAVCHFASTSIPSSSNADPVTDIDNNLRGTVQLLEAMRSVGNKRIVYLSSGGAIYGRPLAIPMREDHPTNPLSSYGVVKLAVEKYLAVYDEQYGFRSAVIRPANPYGPGQGTFGQPGAVTTFLDLALNRQKAVIWGDGSAVRDFVYISDLCDMVLAVLELDVTGVFNCGSGLGTSLTALIKTIEKLTGVTLKLEHKSARPFDPPVVVLDISHARTVLGWKPKIDLSDGIRRTMAG